MPVFLDYVCGVTSFAARFWGGNVTFSLGDGGLLFCHSSIARIYVFPSSHSMTPAFTHELYAFIVPLIIGHLSKTS